MKDNTPTFNQWLKKYFKKPELKIMYKTKLDNKEYSKATLRKRYRRAYLQEQKQPRKGMKYHSLT